MVLWYENSTKLLMLKWSDGNLIVLIKNIISAISLFYPSVKQLLDRQLLNNIVQ